MHASLGIGQHMRQKDALIDFDAVFFRLQQRAFGIDLRARRRQARHQLGGEIRQVVDAGEFGEIFGELAIDGLGVVAEEIFTRIAARGENSIGRRLLFFAA
jgi:hypothetical protein